MGTVARSLDKAATDRVPDITSDLVISSIPRGKAHSIRVLRESLIWMKNDIPFDIKTERFVASWEQNRFTFSKIANE